MTRAVLRLEEKELLTAFESLDAVGLAGDALRRTALRAQTPDAMSGSRLAESSSGTVLLRDERVGGLCTLPVSVLAALRAAGLTALAARELLVARVATAALVGTGTAVTAQLIALAHNLVNLSFVVVCPARDGANGWPTTRLAGHAAERGTTLSFTDHLERAMFGADLLVLTTGADEATYEQIDTSLLARGAVVVNATGGELPARLVRGTDQVFVDDPAAVAGSPLAAAPGLGELLGGRHPGRIREEDTVLVELRGLTGLDVSLASRLHEIALLRGLGTVFNSTPGVRDVRNYAVENYTVEYRNPRGTEPCALP